MVLMEKVVVAEEHIMEHQVIKTLLLPEELVVKE